MDKQIYLVGVSISIFWFGISYILSGQLTSETKDRHDIVAATVVTQKTNSEIDKLIDKVQEPRNIVVSKIKTNEDFTSLIENNLQAQLKKAKIKR